MLKMFSQKEQTLEIEKFDGLNVVYLSSYERDGGNIQKIFEFADTDIFRYDGKLWAISGIHNSDLVLGSFVSIEKVRSFVSDLILLKRAIFSAYEPRMPNEEREYIGQKEKKIKDLESEFYKNTEIKLNYTKIGELEKI